MPAAVLILVYLALVLLPLALAAAQGLAPRTPWDELASGLGLLALAMILVEFVLLGRFRAVTAQVGSDTVMRVHQLLARAALVFALAHPFFYVSTLSPAPTWDVTRATVVNWSWPALWPGIVAWLGLAAVVTMALARDVAGYRYEVWRGLHGLGAVLVAGMGVLHALRAGRYSGDDLLGWVWIGGLALALAALAQVYLIAPTLRLRRPWRVAEVAPAALRTWRVRLKPDGPHRMRYRAGQFAWLNIGRSAFSLNENPFSIASAPSQGPELEFLVKELGDFTSRIGEVAPGTRAYVEGPHGHLTLAGHEEAPGIALIAGGVGLAPLLSLLRELQATGDPRPTLLIHANRVQEQIIAPDELEALRRDHGTRVVHVLSEPPEGWTGDTGLVDDALLRREVAEAGRRDWLFVLCGPPAMLRAVEAALIRLGVPANRILSEQFVYE